ncbi:MAG: TonB-dependent receptor plug domain-containing protein [Butyricimonas faecihominis]
MSGQTLIVTLKEKISKLDEVTVIAYGTQNKREVIGAMSTVKASDIKDIPSPSIANLLQGRVAGMNVTNMTGAPGGGEHQSRSGFNSLSIERYPER